MLPLDRRLALHHLLREAGVMDISDSGLQFIAGWEGKRNRAYNDAAGHCTIGVGHLLHLGPCTPVDLALDWTDERCYAVLRADAQRFVAKVISEIHVPLAQHQVDALVSFAFNLGDLLGVAAVINAGGDVRAEMAKYVHAGGVVLPGLVRRRAAEADLYYSEEEDTVKPFLAWDKDRSRAYLIGPWGAAWITSAADVAALEGMYGKTAVAFSAATIDAIGSR